MVRIPRLPSTQMPKFSTMSDLPVNIREPMFDEFLVSNDTLRVYKDDRLIFWNAPL